MTSKNADTYFDTNEKELPLSGYLAKELFLEESPCPTPHADIYAFGGLALEVSDRFLLIRVKSGTNIRVLLRL